MMLREWNRYDVNADRHVIRLSEGGYYCEVPALEGRTMRELRVMALEAIRTARNRGDPPGEVSLPSRGTR